MATSWFTRLPGWFSDGDVGKVFVFNAGAANIATGTKFGSIQIKNDFSVPLTIQSVRAILATAPTTQSAIFDVNVDGTTIFTTQANRPTIAAAATDSGSVTNMEVVTIAPGSVLTVDVDQIGSGTVGAGLTLTVTCRS